MSQFSVIAALIFSIIIAVFALANSQTIFINYLYGKAEVSAIVVILCAAVSGAFAMFLFSIVRQIKASLRLRGLRNDIKILEERVRELEKERDFFQVKAEQFRQFYVDGDGDDSGELREEPSLYDEEILENNIEAGERKDQT